MPSDEKIITFFAIMSLLIRNGTVVTSERSFRADVLCIDGKIAAMGEGLTAPAGVRVIDASGKLIMPGGIDPHTHCQMPFMGTVAADDFESGTRAAVAGGTTCLIDFVIPGKGQSLIKAYKTWRSWADPKVVCDYGLHVAVTWWDGPQGTVAKEIRELAKVHGVTSFKAFMAYKGSLMVNDEELLGLFKLCKEIGALPQVHAENGDIIIENQKRLLSQGITGPEGHYLSRMEDVEAEATNRAIILASEVRTPIYIVHVMSQEACNVVARARSEGKACIGEALAAGVATDGRAYFSEDWVKAAAHVMSPPLRPDPLTKVHLMRALAAGILSCIGTDNCTFNRAQKAMGKNDFTKIPNGVNGIQDRMSLLWDRGVTSGILSPQQYVAVTSTNVARAFGLFPQKGAVAVGSDADLVIWDPNLTRTISAKTHFHAVDTNIFEGFVVKGNNTVTVSRGRVVFENGKICASKGTGQYLPRKCFGSAFDAIEQREKVALSRKPIPRKANL